MAISNLKLLWQQSEILEQGLSAPSENDTASFEDVFERSTISLRSQLLVLTHRHALFTFYKMHGLRGTLLRNVIGGVVFGTIYYLNGTKLWNSDATYLEALEYK